MAVRSAASATSGDSHSAALAHYAKIKDQVETEHFGKWILIDPRTGSYIISESGSDRDEKVDAFLTELGSDNMALIGCIGFIRTSTN